MPHRQTCADNLLLLGEMLQTASQYIGLCDETLCEEDNFMLTVASGQIATLRVSCNQLDRDLGQLGKRLREAEKVQSQQPS
jgi:hypothetical protein